MTNLGADDFSVLDNGRPRPIAIFSSERTPFSLALMIDASGSMERVIPNIARSTEALVAQFDRGDRINIGTFKGSVLVSSRFTANRERILGRVAEMIQGADLPCVPPSKATAPVSPNAAAARRGGSAVWDGVECAIEALERDTEAIRRVVLVITDGMDNSSYGTAVTAANLATRSGVIVYAVGLSRGLVAYELQSLAASSGGSYFSLDGRSEFTEAFRQVGEELRAQYLLGFEPSQPGASGQLKVGVTRPGLLVRARQAYQSR